MANATITGTASNFGSISGVLAGEAGTVAGTITGVVTGSLTGSVGVPGAQGPQGPAGQGVPTGGTAGQVLAKIDGTNYNTEWVDVSLAGYRTLTDYDFTNVGDTTLSGFGMTLDPFSDLSGTYDSYLKAHVLNLELDSSSGGTVAGVRNRSTLVPGYLDILNETWTDVDGDLIYDGGLGAFLTKNGLVFTTYSSNPAASTMQIGRTSVTFPNGSVQTIAFPGFNNAALTGNPTAPTAATGDNDTSIATTAFVQQELAAGTAVAKNLEVYVRNQTGATLTAGTIVYINGATGNRPTVTKAQANNDANSAQTFGFVKASIANNGFGYVIVRGELENVDTSALTEGQQLYLSPTTAGTWTTTKPYAPDHLVYVGICVRAHPTQGVILVAIQNGYELEEIHDVKITSPSNGQVLKYDSAQGLWVNGTDSSGVAWGGITGTLSAQTDLQTALDAKAPLDSPALIGNVTITTNSSNPALVITQDGSGDVIQFKDVTSDTTYSFIDQNGKVNTTASTTTNASLNIPHGTAPTSPVNGDIWTTTSNLNVRINGNTVAFAPLSFNNTFTNASSTYGSSTATGTINLATGATLSGSTKTVNIGTNGVAGSTTNITIGATAGTSTTTLNGTVNGTTAAADTNSTALATTAFVIGQASSVNPLVDGTAAVGTSLRYARADHVHPTDTTRAPLASPALTGTPTAPTASANTNTTQLATTAFVLGQGNSTAATIAMNGTQAAGTSNLYARADHVHPTDTSLAPLASPALTGTPTAPTASAGTNTTQIATTAFVQQEVPAASTTSAGKVELATETENILGTDTARVLSVNDRKVSSLDCGLWAPGVTNLSTGTSGTGANANSTITALNGRLLSPNALTAGYATRGFNLHFPSNTTSSGYNFGTKSGHSIKVFCGGAWNGTFTDMVIRTVFGRMSAALPVPATLAALGYGWEWNLATKTMNIIAHNGSSLTTKAVTWTPTTFRNYEIAVTSDGAGSIRLYIDGAFIDSTTGGPTSASTAQQIWWQTEIQNTSTSSTGATDFFFQNPKLYTTNG